MQRHKNVRDVVMQSYTMEAAYEMVRMVKEIHEKEGHEIENKELSWYVRHRREWKGNDNEEESGEEKKDFMTKEDKDECCPMGDMFGEICSESNDDYWKLNKFLGSIGILIK